MKVKVAKWGNSLGVRLPKVAAEAAGMKAGSEFDIIVEGSELRLRPTRMNSRELLAEMLAEMKRLGPENRPETIDWGPDVGAEVIDDDYSRGPNPASGGRPGVGRPAADARTRAGRRAARRRADRS